MDITIAILLVLGITIVFLFPEGFRPKIKWRIGFAIPMNDDNFNNIGAVKLTQMVI